MGSSKVTSQTILAKLGSTNTVTVHTTRESGEREEEKGGEGGMLKSRVRA